MVRKETSLALFETVARKIYIIRGVKVMLSSDLARMYGVEPRALVQAVKRNGGRFPSDFMFQLTMREYAGLKSRFVISSWGGLRRAAPYAFTEQGVAMLSSVLKSERAVRINIQIMRVFTKLRAVLVEHQEIKKRVEAHDKQIKTIFEVLAKLLAPPETSRRQIGFEAWRGIYGRPVVKERKKSK